MGDIALRDRQTIYITDQEGNVTPIEGVTEITADTEPPKECLVIPRVQKLTISVRRRQLQRAFFGPNNWRKMNHLPMHRKLTFERKRRKYNGNR